MHQSDGVFSVYYTDRTDRSLMLAWPSAIHPIVAVGHLLGFWHGKLQKDAISAPKNGGSTATFGFTS